MEDRRLRAVVTAATLTLAACQPIGDRASSRTFRFPVQCRSGSTSRKAAARWDRSRYRRQQQGAETLIDDFHVTPADMATAATSPNRLLYALPVFTDSVHLSGRTVVTLRLAASKPAVNVSV